MLKTHSGGRRISVAALITALLAAWRLPVAYGLEAYGSAFDSRVMTLVLAAALYQLLRLAFQRGSSRQWRVCGGLGLGFACMTVVGEHLAANGGFLPVTWLSLLDGAFLLALFGAVYAAALVLLFQKADALLERPGASGTESLFSKLISNGFAVFALLLLCWLPALLACWPGSFGDDAVVQFYQYMDESYSTHHPLLHTLFLGFCMMTGINMDAEGSAAAGLAVYGLAQMVIVAAVVGYACHWLRRKGAPLWARTIVTLFFTLFPFYGLWSFNAVKDVLFAAFALLFILNLIDLWQNGYAGLRSPWRVAGFVLCATVMLLMRNNGVYALCLLLPLAVPFAKGARPRMALLLVGCIAAYFVANGALVRVTEAESGSVVEALPIPLQQIARTLRDDPEALTDEDDQALIDELYAGVSPAEYYNPVSADPVKWAIDYDLLQQELPRLLSLWARLGVTHLQSYGEAFLVQDLPYYLPGAETVFRLDLGLSPLELYPMEACSYLPKYHELLTRYDDTQTFLGLPGVRLLSDTAFWAWVCIAGFAYALYRRQRPLAVAFGFLLAYWLTCLLGPVAAMRYVLVLFYGTPVLLAAMAAPTKKGKENEA